VRRLLSVLSIGVMATIEAPMPNAALVEGMVQRAEDLAYVEAFAPARLTLEHAIDRAASLGNRRLMALSLDRLGSVLAFGGDATAGLERHQRALALARDLHDQATIASVLASIGLTHWRQGEYQEALTRLHEALTIQETLDDAVGAARTHVFIGRVHFKKAAYDTAKTHYMRAVSLLEPSGNRRWLSIALEDLGDLALERGFFTEGIDHLQRSLDAR
jgi:tetratricopeptide (TPR) repeat protein